MLVLRPWLTVVSSGSCFGCMQLWLMAGHQAFWWHGWIKWDGVGQSLVWCEWRSMRRSTGGWLWALWEICPSSFQWWVEFPSGLAWHGVYSEGWIGARGTLVGLWRLLVVVDDECFQVTGVARIFRERLSVCGLVMHLLVGQVLSSCRAWYGEEALSGFGCH